MLQRLKVTPACQELLTGAHVVIVHSQHFSVGTDVSRTPPKDSQTLHTTLMPGPCQPAGCMLNPRLSVAWQHAGPEAWYAECILPVQCCSSRRPGPRPGSAPGGAAGGAGGGCQVELPATLQVQRLPPPLAEAATARGCEQQMLRPHTPRAPQGCEEGKVRSLGASVLLGPICWQ